jgi:isopenicillin-N epimerase
MCLPTVSSSPQRTTSQDHAWLLRRFGGPEFWALEPEITFLNHGAFGSCPRPVLAQQRALQDRLEQQPVRFFVDEFEALWDAARAEVARFVGARMEDVVFVRNATEGVNILLRAFPLAAADEVLVTDHEYNACRNALEAVCAERAARVRVVSIPFPLTEAAVLMERFLDAIGPRTRLALLDHVTSPTGLVLPVAELGRALAARGVEVIVDGAHGPGLVPVELERLGVLGYAGNCHKWLCAPKGAGLLYVRSDFQARVRPLIISHGANSTRTDRSRFLLEFGWMGTMDPTPWLCVPEAIRALEPLLPGGWSEIRKRNRELAVRARRFLCGVLELDPPAPEPMLAAMAALPLPAGTPTEAEQIRNGLDPLRNGLWERYRIEVPVFPWPRPPHRLLRISAHLYNAWADYERLAEALQQWRKEQPVRTGW